MKKQIRIGYKEEDADYTIPIGYDNGEENSVAVPIWTLLHYIANAMKNFPDKELCLFIFIGDAVDQFKDEEITYEEDYTTVND